MRLSKKTLVCLLLVAVMAVSAVTVSGAASNQRIIWGMFTDIETLNPILSEGSAETDILNCIFSKLVTMNDKLEIEPDLLTKMPEISTDGLTYTFQLRKGVKFHDGVELTAEDVKFLYEMRMAEGNAVPSRHMWEKIAKFEIKDKYNFVITLKELDVTWLEGWCYSEGLIPPKHILEKEFKAGGNSLTKGGAFSRNPVGSGPYKFVKWEPDQYIMLQKNPNYFRKGQPKINQVIFKIVPDTNTLLAQFKNGEIDIYDRGQANQLKEVKAMKDAGSKIEIYTYPSFIYMHADFNLRNPIFQDKRVRQALNYAFPKKQFIETVLDGVGIPADSNIPPISWAYNPDVKKYDYNPAKAKQLLEEAGWKVGPDGIRVKDGKKLAFRISTNSGNKIRERFVEICKQEWDAIGADVTIQNYEAATLFGDILDNIKFDIIVFAWVSGADPDCRSLWHSDQVPDENNGAGQNYVAYKNPRIDYLVDAGLKTNSKEERIKIYHEVQSILAEDVPYMFVYYYMDWAAVPANLKNFKPNSTQANDTWNVYEWEIK